MTTYNPRTFSATLVTTDLQLFFEMTRNTYTLDPKFAERWSKWIVEMVKERLWNYSTAVMTTALGDEIYNDYLYPKEDANGGMQRSSQRMRIRFGRSTPKYGFIKRMTTMRAKKKWSVRIVFTAGN
jgi:hypothetical protein